MAKKFGCRHDKFRYFARNCDEPCFFKSLQGCFEATRCCFKLFRKVVNGAAISILKTVSVGFRFCECFGEISRVNLSYASSHRQHPQSSIRYPTIDSRAKEARIDVTDPIFSKNLGQVCLRPVVMSRPEEMIATDTLQSRNEREAYAHQPAFGER